MTVVFSPEAETAARYTDAIVTYCEGLKTMPRRGTRRDDIRPGLRTISFRKRVVIAFCVEAKQVAILGVFYAGRNYEAILQDEDHPQGGSD